jgi:DNA-binding NarL/FixJ family response regulator
VRMDESAYSKLSPREKELANALHCGMSRADIRGSMGISAGTIQNYINSIYKRLGIGSVAELVLIVERNKAVPK